MKSILQRQKRSIPSPEIFVEREVFSFAQKQLDHTLIKAIVGPRRVGKSVLGFQLMFGKKFGYINFDDPDILMTMGSFEELTQALEEVYGMTEFLYFDEIQNVPNWELYVNSLHRQGKNIVLTGSNANLLSSELATHLAGRVIEIDLWPFSWQESLQARQKLTVSEYCLEGNYPEVMLKNIEPEVYYQSLFQTSLIKDIISRYGVRNPLDLEKLSLYLLSTITSLYSYNSLAQKTLLSVPTVSQYIHYLKESLLFYELPKFSTKSAEVLKSHKKMYVVDYAFSTFSSLAMTPNRGAAYENAVFLQLVRSGHIPGKNLFYAENKNHEIDFVIVDGYPNITYMQVAYNVEDSKTLERELKAFEGLQGNKVLVTQHKPNSVLVPNDIQVMTFQELVQTYQGKI